MKTRGKSLPRRHVFSKKTEGRDVPGDIRSVFHKTINHDDFDILTLFGRLRRGRPCYRNALGVYSIENRRLWGFGKEGLVTGTMPFPV